MKLIFKNWIISLLSLALFLTFIGALIMAAFVIQQPNTVISLIQNLHPTPTPSPVVIKGIGIIGDSQSDEYQADDHRGTTYADTTMNWVELLAKYRHLNFGQWGVWEEPRRTGFAYNWARSGATAYSLLVSGQALGVADQVKRGQVNVVVIFIGANDFAPYITDDGYQAIYTGTLTDAQVAQKINVLVAHIRTAVDIVQHNGNPKIILVKIPDWGNHIGVQLAFPILEQRMRVSQAVNYANSQLDDIAKEKHLITMDPNQFLKDISQNGDGVTILVGDVMMQRLLLNNDPKNIFLNDGVHTGTVINGLFANYMIDTFNTYLGTHIQEFSTTEILRNAGIY